MSTDGVICLRSCWRAVQRRYSGRSYRPKDPLPFDKDTIFNSVAKTGRVILINEAPKTGNYATEISQTINEEMFEFLKAPIKRITGLDTPTAFAPKLENYYLPDKKDII